MHNTKIVGLPNDVMTW